MKLLSKRRRYVFEFRHPSWYTDECFKLLERRGASLCISDHRDAPAPWIATAPLVYVRGHGPGGAYKGHYIDRTLGAWADRILAWNRDGREIYVYFDNDQKSAAPFDAAKLRTICSGVARRCFNKHYVGRLTYYSTIIIEAMNRAPYSAFCVDSRFIRGENE